MLNVDQTFLEMRWRCLSLAADLDRLARSNNAALQSDARMLKLQRALHVLLENEKDRAARVEMIFSDMTPPPEYKNS